MNLLQHTELRVLTIILLWMWPIVIFEGIENPDLSEGLPTRHSILACERARKSASWKQTINTYREAEQNCFRWPKGYSKEAERKVIWTACGNRVVTMLQTLPRKLFTSMKTELGRGSYQKQALYLKCLNDHRAFP